MESNKLVLVLATSTSMTGVKKKALKRILFINYPVQFKKNTAEVWTLIDVKIEINVMVPAYTKKLSFQMQKTDVGAQKIDRSILETYSMVIASF